MIKVKFYLFKIIKKILNLNKNKRIATKFSESELIKKLFKESKDNPGVIFDVGAHFGETFYHYEQLTWNVYAFEPDSDNRAKIRCNSKRTKIFDFAISNVDDELVQFYKSDESTGISSLEPFHNSHIPNGFVKTKTLRSICNNEKITKINFLKIDAEGYDLLVLQGFPFEAILPEVILCEFEDSKTLNLGYKYTDLGDFLLDNGYDVFLSEWYPIERYGIEHRWKDIKKYPVKIENEDAWGNFIAVRPEFTALLEQIIQSYTTTIKL